MAVLRGINVGGHNRVPMPALRDAVGELGYGDVRTYVQSGNVVFTAEGDPGPGEVADRVADVVANAFGADVPVVVRTGPQLADAVANGPFVRDGLHPEEAPTAFHVTFLAAPPDPARWKAAAAEAERFVPDVCALAGADIHLHVPGGRYSDSKLTNAWFERQLGVTATTRNWKTVTVLAAMATG